CFAYCFCFFFSSRRRHTRWPRDWSSDVCSSDLLRFRRFASARRTRCSPVERMLLSRTESFAAGSRCACSRSTTNIPKRLAGLSRSEEHTSELQSRGHLVCRLLLEKKNNKKETKT